MSYTLTQGIPLTVKPHVKIYCDAAYYPVDGWSVVGAILFCGDRRHEVVKQVSEVNSARAELAAAVVAIDYLTRPCSIELYSDYESMILGMNNPNRYIHHPEKRASLEDLWRKLDKHNLYHAISWHWQTDRGEYIYQVHNLVQTKAMQVRAAERKRKALGAFQQLPSE